jgi:hypothetical protein
MKKKLLLPAALLAMVLLAACGRKSGDESSMVTRRIQYDVSIKSPDPDFDWWVQNIEGSNREQLVNNIIQSATEGKVKAYDFISSRLLSVTDIKGILRRVDTVAFESPDPPHNMVDTVLVHEVALRDITRLRFLEEWYMDKTSLAFTKKVVGICPMVESYTDSGDLKGYKPLFWVFFDDKYPGDFQQSK